MVKYISIPLLVILISGCSLFSTKDDYKIVRTPVYKCPDSLMDWPEVRRPHLKIFEINEEYFRVNNIPDGKRLTTLVNAYKTSIKQLQGYSTQLEETLNINKSACRNYN